MRRRKALYWTDAAEWIATHDEPDEMDADAILGNVTVGMISDLTGVSQELIAERVSGLRKIRSQTFEVQHFPRTTSGA